MKKSLLLVLVTSLLMVSTVGFTVSLTACSPNGTILDDTNWILESYGEPGNPKTVITGTEISIEFVSTEDTVRGRAGCNHYFGGYDLKGSQLLIPGPIGATEMYCMEPEGVMDQEQEYLAILQLAESYEIDGDKLQINCGNQALIFNRD
jgi:heat shock protein HslJ